MNPIYFLMQIFIFLLFKVFGTTAAFPLSEQWQPANVDALWALQLDDGEDTAAAAYLTSAAEGEQTTSTFLDQDEKNHPLFRAEDDDYWRPDRYAREALAYSESHDDLLGRTLREKTTRSVWQGVRDKTSETGRALGEQIISDPWGTVKAVGGAIKAVGGTIKDDTWEMVRHPIRTAGNIGKGVWTLGKDAAYNLGNSAKSTWAGSFGTENALNTLYGQNMSAPLLGMSAIQASLTAAQVVPAAKGAQALGKGALRAGKTVGEKGLFQLGRGEGIANAGVSGKVADGVVGGNVAKGAGKEIGILRDAAKGKGNFGLGSGTRAEADKLGKAWVGDGAKVASDDKTLVSKDGLRQYRPPSYKSKLDKTQANFERKFPGQTTKRWQSNGHLDITD